MKPKRLEFCGINSFSRVAVIDFTNLLSGGIFGIFGDTGSGKTTILDSMIFALYGRVDRIRGGAGNELINYNCDKAYVIFDFETETPSGRKTYRIEREIKRKNSMQSVMLSELDGERIVALSDGVKNTNAKIQDIVGLSFDDFKKCIALPQGEFAQFVKADRGDRLRLISRLFGLEKYGDLLNARVKDRYADVKSELDKKEGELKGYADIRPEVLEETKQDAARLQAQRAVLEEEYGRHAAKFEREKAQYERAKRYRALLARQETLAAKAGQIEDKKRDLSRLAAAKDVVLLEQKRVQRERELAAARTRIQTAQTEHDKAAAELRQLQNSIDPAAVERELEEVTEKIGRLAYGKNDAVALREYAERRERLQAELKSEKEKQCKAEEAAQRLRQEAGEVGEKIARLGDPELGAFLGENFESMLLNEEYRRSKQYFEDRRADLHASFNGGELYERVDAALEERIGHYARILQSAKKTDVAEILEEYRGVQKRRNDLSEALSNAKIGVAKAEKTLDGIRKNVCRLSEEIAQCTEKSAQTLEKLRSSFGIAELSELEALEKKLVADKSALSAKKQTFQDKTAALTERMRQTELDRIKDGALCDNLKNADGEDKERIDRLLAEAQLGEAAQAFELANRIGDEEAARAEVEAYKKAVTQVEANMRMLREEGEIAEISEELYREAEEKFAALTKKRQAVAEQAAVLEENLLRMQERLNVKKRLEKEYAETEKEERLISRLKELVRGNAFMEFVAEEYLSDISAAATATLLRLTNGRYFIRYSQGFFIGDNLCAGELRSVNTLSGGETFLVSLALALSLSSAIYAKSLKPIEFFFLDEGFGTLDEKLIDTVMDSLEKLKNDRFAIGLISHVEELKHRIGNKITVIGAAEGGSSEIHIN